MSKDLLPHIKGASHEIAANVASTMAREHAELIHPANPEKMERLIVTATVIAGGGTVEEAAKAAAKMVRPGPRRENATRRENVTSDSSKGSMTKSTTREPKAAYSSEPERRHGDYIEAGANRCMFQDQTRRLAGESAALMILDNGGDGGAAAEAAADAVEQEGGSFYEKACAVGAAIGMASGEPTDAGIAARSFLLESGESQSDADDVLVKALIMLP